MKSPRLLNLNNGKTDHCNLVEIISSFHQLLQDGGNFSNTRIVMLSMKKENAWMSKATMMQKTEMFSCGTDITV